MNNINVKCKHQIGILYDYENSDLVTFDELIEKIQYEISFYKELDEAGLNVLNHHPPKLLAYFDRRCGSALHKFDYCPYCGKKLDWKAMKEEAKKIESTGDSK